MPRPSPRTDWTRRLMRAARGGAGGGGVPCTRRGGGWRASVLRVGARARGARAGAPSPPAAARGGGCVTRLRASLSCRCLANGSNSRWVTPGPPQRRWPSCCAARSGSWRAGRPARRSSNRSCSPPPPLLLPLPMSLLYTLSVALEQPVRPPHAPEGLSLRPPPLVLIGFAASLTPY